MKRRYCKKGHDKHATGQTAHGCCKVCQSERNKAWIAANPERYLAAQRAHRAKPEVKAKNAAKMRAVRAADPEGYAAYSRQYKRRWSGIVGLPDIEAPIGTPCQICKQPTATRPHADHNHATGKFRGWLCGSCNLFLGRLENTDLVAAARAYLAETDG